MRSSLHFTYTLTVLLYIVIIYRYFQGVPHSPQNHPPSVIAAASDRLTRHRYCLVGGLQVHNESKSLLSCLLLLCGDIQSNPGPGRNAQVYLCGLCELPVTWKQDGLCYDCCDVWHHRSCIELCSADYDMLAKHSHVQWLCCRCDSINITSFTFHSFELTTSNFFNPLSYMDTSVESLPSSAFSPLHTSSPINNDLQRRSRQSRSSRPHSTSSQAPTYTSSLFCVSEKKGICAS